MVQPGVIALVLAARFVPDRLDVIAVRIENKRGVVARMILRSVTWRAVILATRVEGRFIERLHLLFVFCTKRQMHARRGWRASGYLECAARIGPVF